MLSSLLGSNSAALVWTRIGNDFSDLGPLISPLTWCNLMSPQACFPLPILLPSAQREKKSLTVESPGGSLSVLMGSPVSFASCRPLTNGEAHCQTWLFLKSFYIWLKHPQEEKCFILPSSSPTPSLESPYTLCLGRSYPINIKTHIVGYW